jgi:hypothetical protein
MNPAVKPRWFEKHWPERVQDVKNLFCIWSHFLVFLSFVATEANITSTPARPSRSNWADEVLGMDTPERPTHGQSLKDEVQAYFLEPYYTLGSVRYWEVCYIPFHLSSELKLTCTLRRVSFEASPHSPSCSTFCPSKGLPSLASGFFPPVPRPTRTGAIGWRLI